MKELEKKYLTNRSECAKIANVPPLERVPCKLNNVTNETHQTEAQRCADEVALSTGLVNYRKRVTIKSF